jgi:hypothetical protein
MRIVALHCLGNINIEALFISHRDLGTLVQKFPRSRDAASI